LDPFTALNLTGNLVQFLDFTFKIVAHGLRGYNSAFGVESKYVELETIAKHLQILASSLCLPDESDSGRALTENETFEKLCQSCREVSSDLLHAIEQIKVKSSHHRRWKCLYQALRLVWEKERFDELKERLDGLRQEINVHML
jgi:hypothetical protein